jgi:glycosyltransferase involved in cell wall biosynthesis
MVVVRNEERHLERCLRTMLDQTLDPARYEIIVVDSMSTDRSRDIVRRFIDENPGRRIRLIDNPGIILSCGWNNGIRAARGEYVIRPDAHGEVPPDFLEKSLKVMQAHPEAACVGGVIQTRGHGFWGEVIARVLSSPFGVGNSDFRVGTEPGPGNPVFALYKRQVLLDIGGFDERIPLNQDNLCHARLRAAGHLLYLDPEIRSTYYCRASLGALARAMIRRAKWVILMVRHTQDRVLQLRYLVPLAFLLTLIATGVGGFFFWPLWLGFAIVLAAYLAGAYAYAIRMPLGFWQRVAVPAATLTTHLSYGLGSLIGLCTLPFYRPRSYRPAGEPAMAATPEPGEARQPERHPG